MAVIAREFRLFVRNTMLSVALKLVFSSDCSTDQLGMQSICFALLCTLVFLNILEGQFLTRFLYGSVPEDWRSSFSKIFFFHREMRLIESDSPVTSFIGNESTKECIMRMSFVVLRLLLYRRNKTNSNPKSVFPATRERDWFTTTSNSFSQVSHQCRVIDW